MMKKQKKDSRIKKQTQRLSLIIFFAVVVFCALWVAIFLAVGIVGLLIQFNVFEGVSEEIRMSNITLVMALISIVMGAALVILLGKIPQRSINKFIDSSAGSLFIYSSSLDELA